MRVIGLTGSIAMGKSTAAQAFRNLGLPVFDSDAAVHSLYAKGGAAVSPLQKLVPQAIADGAVDRQALSAAIREKPELLKEVEKAVHPLVWQAQENFLKQCDAQDADLAVLDIPLLFETGRDAEVDFIVVVSAPAEIQRQRALARPGMTAEKLDQLLARQMPDAQKRRRATHVIRTGLSRHHAQAAVRRLVKASR